MNTIGTGRKAKRRKAKRSISLPKAPFDIPPEPKEITRACGRVTDASVSTILASHLRQYPEAKTGAAKEVSA